jgi:8-oxo-dGTP diphosphatase
MPKVRVVCGVAQRTHSDQAQVFLAKRGPGGPHAGLWEFPGGKVEAGESDVQAIQRELQEELGCEIEVLNPLGTEEDSRILLVAMAVRFFAPPQCLDAEAIAWWDLSALHDLPMPPCDQKIVQLILPPQNRL